MKKRFFALICLILFTGLVFPQKKAITFDDFIHVKPISDPQVSPDGKQIVFTATKHCYHRDKVNANLYMVSTGGGPVKQLTFTEGYDGGARWSPDGKKIAFISTRSGSAQIWMLPISGGEARRISNIKTGASGIVWSPNGKYILFTSDVESPVKNESEKGDRELLEKYDKSSAKIIDKLLYRHWNSWRVDTRSNLFIMPAEGGKAKNLTPWDNDIPPISLGGYQDYTFSPDGKEICFTMNTEKVVTLNTNNDIFTIPVEGAEKPKKLTENKANDNYPRYSPDGKYIAYRAMKRPGFEADQYNLILYDRKTGDKKNLTEDFDRSIGEYLWLPDGSGFIATCDDFGNNSIYKISISGEIEKLTEKTYNSAIRITGGGKTLIFERQAINAPAEIYKMDLSTKDVERLTEFNKGVLENLDLNPVEYFSYEGAEREVYGMLLKPPLFDETKKYPVIFLIHGGPQGSWHNSWHPRWNAQMFAAPGYVVVMLNPNGSTGYGQELTDAISGDWGGACFEDIMNGVDYILNNYDFVNKDKIGAAGGSFGGYMVDWIAGHTNRFNCLITHAGVFDLKSMFYVTEELWFPLWEFEGNPTESELYRKFSPSNYVDNFETPTMVIHGALDFRVPIGQGLGMFTALQIMDVPSKLVYFPDEGHFVTKPQNRLVWWNQVHKWFGKYLK